MREVVLDTETTGLDPSAGHRVVEIGCVELIDAVPTSKTFQCYINPERDMPAGAQAVHGLTAEFLSEHPIFEAVADGFLEFIGDSPLIIHNAEFDLGFLNAELKRLDRPPLSLDRTVDTVQMARQRFPGAKADLDTLCRRFAIDNSNRALHGALKDADLLARVYVELTGGRQRNLELAAAAATDSEAMPSRVARPPRPHGPTAAEKAAHAKFLEGLKDPLWFA